MVHRSRRPSSGLPGLTILLVCLPGGCGDSKPGTTDPVVLRAKRELVAAYYEEDRYAEALEAADWILDRPEATAQDFVNAAAVELALTKAEYPRAQELVDEAIRRAPDLASAAYCAGWLAYLRGDLEPARDHYRRAMELDPHDIPSRYRYASLCADLGQREEAITELKRILEGGIERVGSFYLSAEYRLRAVYMRSRDPAERQEGVAWGASYEQHRAEGWPEPQGTRLQRGYLGRVQPPPLPSGDGRVESTPVALSFERVEDGLLVEAGAIASAELCDVDADHRLDIVAIGPGGAAYLAHQVEGARFTSTRLADGPYRVVRAGDLANRGRQSLLLLGDGATTLLAPNGRLEYTAVELSADPAVDGLFADYDHDGDLDVVLAGATGLRVLRNDGLPEGDLGAAVALEPGVVVDRSGEPTERVRFTDATEGSGLPVDAQTWVRVEDFDADNDVDFLCGAGDGRALLCSNLRRGEFEVIAATTTGIIATHPPELADLDRDGFVDLVSDAGVQRNLRDGRFGPPAPLSTGSAFALADLDLDGQADLVSATAAATRVRRGSLLVAGGAEESLPVKPVGTSSPIVGDVDFDGDLDLVGAAAGGGLEVWRSAMRPAAPSLRVVLEGTKDNAGGRLALVEARGGDLYERRMGQGLPMVFGYRSASVPDTVRVTWPNGVIQYAILPSPDEPVVVRQKEGLVGSCPFLYAHDGERWQFVSDVLGATPLGLPMEAGKFVPPDHDELVRIDGSRLGAVDGEFRLQITEELREVTYLDRAQLWVVDHPDDVVVHPEERFSFPPFPPLRIHSLRDVREVERAVDQDGRDWTAALRAEDGEYAAPFDAYAGQFLGLATPHWLELTLPKDVAAAERVRLVMTGWFYWTDASVNVAAGHDARYAFVPPLLLVPGEDGTFVETGPPIGFPAGKPKTMVIDVKDMLSRDALARGDRRVRIASSIRLYWDAIAVAVDDGSDAELQVTKLEPSRADVYYRGFSRPLPPTGPNQPERFDFDALMEPRWNQHRGDLTRYGSVMELLDEVDDRFAIFSAGDAIDLRFDAAAVPPLTTGRARTYLLLLDGWAKDDDPNTEHAGRVEPLPFHGMSGYPYPPSEAYPDDELHRAYRETWNTRPGRRLIPDLTGERR